MDRPASLLALFRLIDKDNNGYVEPKELKSLASSPTAYGKLEEAHETLTWLDLDGDQRVSPEEFVEVFTFVCSQMDDREFELFVEDAKVQAGAAPNREMMLKRVYQQLDRDRSGWVAGLGVCYECGGGGVAGQGSPHGTVHVIHARAHERREA
ncbi:hypothetical protein HYH03_010293 [Edaphochlamys debaryana]|uniref:EF-hand domain-containing protein n=1 Tax=Edaphochlamys debaryana TaxID=47281 RepID=A0A835XX73_9CHLO|nr:hypothetical protein HYH03_010293 [Edaphochlamys debaryana]|eukprot:KAG2491287.1 hypothetical protein HYH03_010293 [Edaphochlamys debaryana]